MLHLPDLSKQLEQILTLNIKNRLPDFLVSPCNLKVNYKVDAKDDFYLIHLQVSGDIIIICQRCLQEFTHPYKNQTVIAVCNSERRAEELQELYECIVSSNFQVDLHDLVIDELHLYAIQFHPDIKDCNSEITQFLSS